MARQLWKATYTADGLKGLVAEGGTARSKQAQAVVEAVGGTIESMYYSDNATAWLIVNVPDNAATAAAVMTVNSTGAIEGECIAQLLTPEELDASAKTAAGVLEKFRPPGS